MPSTKPEIDNGILKPGDWPLDNRYWCICRTCEQRFFGPKRASTCWIHTSGEMQEYWIVSSK